MLKREFTGFSIAGIILLVLVMTLDANNVAAERYEASGVAVLGYANGKGYKGKVEHIESGPAWRSTLTSRLPTHALALHTLTIIAGTAYNWVTYAWKPLGTKELKNGWEITHEKIRFKGPRWVKDVRGRQVKDNDAWKRAFD